MKGASSVHWGLVCVGKRIEPDSNETCLWMMFRMISQTRHRPRLAGGGEWARRLTAVARCCSMRICTGLHLLMPGGSVGPRRPWGSGGQCYARLRGLSISVTTVTAPDGMIVNLEEMHETGLKYKVQRCRTNVISHNGSAALTRSHGLPQCAVITGFHHWRQGGYRSNFPGYSTGV